MHCADPPAGYQLVEAEFQAPAGEHSRNTAACPTGTRVLAGGFRLGGYGQSDPVTDLKLVENAPVAGDGDTDQWLVGFANEGPGRLGG